MHIDKTTLYDLSVFNHEEEFSLFHRLNETLTVRGKEQLALDFSQPLKDIEEIAGVQAAIRYIQDRLPYWPRQISNGTIMVIEKFYHTTLDTIPSHPSAIGVLMYRLFSTQDFSLVKYTAGHLVDFIWGMAQFVREFKHPDTPPALLTFLNTIEKNLSRPEFRPILNAKTISDLSTIKLLSLANYFRYNYKITMMELLGIYGRLDAWYSMALVAKKYDFTYPQLESSKRPRLEIKGLRHFLLTEAVAYDMAFTPEKNFLFLTGANMAGKSTFIKALGIASYMAHLGMAVPANEMKMSVLDGILSNINITDNIVKGESYFYNEVKRVKDTIVKITDGGNWLILVDELFKGTNVQDAMKCSAAVIDGFVKIDTAIFVVSTHLYEIGEGLKKYPNLFFKYFETAVVDNKIEFSYSLKDGISNDRLGYLILQREGVVKMLDEL